MTIVSTIDRAAPAAGTPRSSAALRAQFQRAANDIEGLLTTMAAAPTGAFRANSGARIVRLNDRLFLGSATANDGAKPNVAKDWLTQLINWPVYNATGASLSPNGRIAWTVGSQTLGFDPVEAGTTQTTIGLAAFALANNPGTYPADYFAAYALYGEGRTYPGTVSNAFAAELEAINLRGAHDGLPTPYQELTLSATHALRLGSGGGQGLSPYDAQAAISIVPNGAKFRVGIVFDKAALTGANGVTGFGDAMQLGRGHRIVWFHAGGGTGTEVAAITSTATQPVHSIQFQNGSTLHLSPGGNIDFTVANVAASANGIGVRPSIAGAPVELESFGADAGVDIALRPKGTGNVRLYADVLSFFSDAGNQLGYLQNQVTTPGLENGLVFANGGPFVFGRGAIIWAMEQTASATNYLATVNAGPGTAPGIHARGGDVDVDVLLQPKGAGTVAVQAPNTTAATAGSASALPGVPGGYITLRINGALRKIPYWNV